MLQSPLSPQSFVDSFRNGYVLCWHLVGQFNLHTQYTINRGVGGWVCARQVAFGIKLFQSNDKTNTLHCIVLFYILSVFALWLPKAVTLTLILIQWSGKVPFQFEKCQILIKQYGFRENGGWNITIWTTQSKFLWLRISNGQRRSTDNHILFSSLNILHLKWIQSNHKI